MIDRLQAGQQLPEPYANRWRALRHESGRNGNQGLVAPIRSILDSQRRPDGSPRAIGPRRVTYKLLDNWRHVPAVASLIKQGEVRYDNAKEVLDQAVAGTLVRMREIGLVHPNEISDSRSKAILPYAAESPSGYLEELIEEAERGGYREDRQAGQRQRIEIWTEAADTIADIRAVCGQYGAPVVSSSGAIVWDVVSKLGQRMAADLWHTGVKRPTEIGYLGDFDPAGLAISDTIRHAEIQASRWYRYWESRRDHDSDIDRWAAVCGEYPKGGAPAEWVKLEITRLGVVQADLDGRTTSPVKRKLVIPEYVNGKIKTGTGMYARWWPEGETRTLQLEGLEIEDVVERVRDHVEALTDWDVYRRVTEAEHSNRLETVVALRKARRRLRRGNRQNGGAS